jgi:1,2-dihydroxy-3-keto-5-methylthiopentene dioxygenase
MSELRVYPNDSPGGEGDPAPVAEVVLTEHAEIAEELAAIGVRFERWQTEVRLPPDASPETVIAAYQGDVDRLMRDNGFAAVDVLRMTPDHPDREALRAKFLDEHTHSEFEVRFFVEGQGLFYLHAPGRVYAVTCTQGDLISVPAGTPHWFDMGPSPSFTAIRLFTNPEGWVAHFTGSPIASRYPRLAPSA